MFGITADQVKSAVRFVLVAAGGVLVNKGYGDASMVEAMAGGGAALVALIWSMVFHAGVNKADVVDLVKGEATIAKEQEVLSKV